MRLLGGLPRPARGEAQPALARRPSDPRLRASGRGWARGLAPLQAPTPAGVRGERRVNFCRLGGCGRVCVGVDVRWPPGSLPLCGPHPAARSCVCSANPPCLCSYAARARPPPTRARPAQDNPPHPLGQPWRRRLRNTAAPPPPQRNVVSAGTGLRDRAQAREARGGAREMQELDAGAPSPSLSSVHGKVYMETAGLGVWRQRCRGGEELGQVQ